jgi:hypothetical protein
VAADRNQKQISGVNKRSPEDKKMIPFSRVWCLFEIFHAATLKKEQESMSHSSSVRTVSQCTTSLDENESFALFGNNLYNVYASTDLEIAQVQGSPHQNLTILFKTGTCEHSSDGMQHTFKVDKKVLDLEIYIDFNEAESTNEVDKEWIFNQIEKSHGGVRGLEKKVTEVLTTAKILDSDPILESAVRGDAKSTEAIRNRPELYILNSFRGGFAHFLRSMMNVNDEFKFKVSIYNRLNVAIEIYMVSYDGTSLNLVSEIKKHKSATLSMAEGSFWIARNPDDSDVGVYIATAVNNKWIIY